MGVLHMEDHGKNLLFTTLDISHLATNVHRYDATLILDISHLTTTVDMMQTCQKLIIEGQSNQYMETGLTCPLQMKDILP